ncbi:MAG: carbohydrate binding family 9 domain-containing protein [Kangiellaceae bacterium]|nr:carbohydrate binding family 9 domain-containing protein [Kangiellaceae bacterium]MCW9001013.1 carbohydrate binding family 9 domain-containing protein [Kangiellaceae bacterium]MCW9016927.1 carbohydrate binding family 9 domain-containing protein [Kangiellaceae bacterium]
MRKQKVSHNIPHIESPINVDGQLNEGSWQNALKMELKFETNPGENTPAPVETFVYLYEDGHNLYVGFDARDPNPELIRDYLTDRDNVWDSDFVGVKFDTFGESRKAFQFFVNALGVQGDATQEDFRGDDSNWDAIWNSAGKITDTGYIVEMSIPFRALRFPEKEGKQMWPMEIVRFYPREYRHRIANTPVDRDISCLICQFDYLVGMENVKPSKNLTLVPTLVNARADRRNVQQSAWQEGEFDTEVGLDLRWGITQDTVLNATLNPDFSQVEADAAQIDVNNPFTLFLNEKRPFFLDGADYFNSQRTLFYSRNIIQPNYGVKVTGQTNGHSYGLIAVDDDHTSVLLPGRLSSDVEFLANRESENLIARYSYDLGNKNNVGFYYTERSGTDYSNKVTAIDGKYWFDQNHSLSAQYISTDTENPFELVNEYGLAELQSGDALSIQFDHDSRNWWGYVNYVDFDKDFRADLGFVSQVNYDKKVVGLGHRWYFDADDNWWTQIELGGDWDQTNDNDGKLLEEEVEANIVMQGALQSEIVFGFVSRDKLWVGETREEYFDELFYFFNNSIEPISGLKLELDFNWGDRIDFENGDLGRQFSVEPEISWQIDQNWLAQFEFEQVRFDNNGQELFTAEVTNLRVAYQMNIRSFLRFTLQQFDLDSDSPFKNRSSQLLYSYKINPQTLFFAGYSDAGFKDGNVTDLRKTARSVFMKFSYAWQH